MKRLPLVAKFILFIALCASLAYWAMLIYKQQSDPVAPFALETASGLAGGRPAGNIVATNFLLKGVIASGPDGLAILSVDGKPPQTVGVGMEAAPGVTVKEVNGSYVLLDVDGTIKRVDLLQNANGGLGNGGLPPVGRSGASKQAPVANIDHVQIVASKPTPTMNIDNDLTASQQLRQHRPSGMGPAVFGAKSISMPTPMPTPEPQSVELNEALMRNPMLGGGNPGMQK